MDWSAQLRERQDGMRHGQRTVESNCGPDLTSDEEWNGDKSEASSTNLVYDRRTEEDAKCVTSRRDETGDRRI